MMKSPVSEKRKNVPGGAGLLRRAVPGASSPEALAWNGFRANIYNNGLKDFAAATAVGQIACVYRLAGGAIELNWSVSADGVSWKLLRERAGEPFEIIAEGLRSEAAMISVVDDAAEPGIVYRYRLEAVDDPALSSTTDEIMIPVSRAHLYQNHPNPFNPSTTMSFRVPGGVEYRSAVHLAVYDAAARSCALHSPAKPIPCASTSPPASRAEP